MNKDNNKPIKRKPRLLFTCCNMGWLHRTVMPAIIWACKDDRVAQVDFCFPVDGPYELKLNQVARQVIDLGYDFWLNVDDDNGPTRNPIDLMELNLPVIGCPTPIWKDKDPKKSPYLYSACDKLENGMYVQHQPLVGLQEVDAVGSGCMLVTREALLKLDGSVPFFKRKLSEDETKVILGPDYYFCERIKAAGMPVHAHYDFNCNHVKEVELGQMISRMITFARESDVEKVESDAPQYNAVESDDGQTGVQQETANVECTG